jgi:tRNA (guanine37-N1)-methyltransferase
VDVTILSLFPEFFDSPFATSILKRAIQKGLLCVDKLNIRDFAKNKHRRVDDKPYGGGPGMLMKPEPICGAIDSVRRENSHVVYLSAQGKPLKAKRCEELAKYKHLILLCGHYEGVDQRAIDLAVDEEISIGDYVLTSGAPAALVLVDAVSRFIPGVVGNEQGVYQDSFHIDEGLEGPKYTRPPEYRGHKVPDELINGNHQKRELWISEKAKEMTQKVRPEIL